MKVATLAALQDMARKQGARVVDRDGLDVDAPRSPALAPAPPPPPAPTTDPRVLVTLETLARAAAKLAISGQVSSAETRALVQGVQEALAKLPPATPARSKPITAWEFTPERDRAGRIVKITAKAIR